MVTRIWSLLTICLDDYSVDSRGDVGSWIRMATCESLVPIHPHTTIEDVKVTIGKLLRLSVEKMDRVRIVAGRTLSAIIPLSNEETNLRDFIIGYDPFIALTTGWKRIHSRHPRKCTPLQYGYYLWTPIARKY
jgi:Tubulin folding cofactor D C terminal